MVLDIISIGDELLIGQTLNTNAHWISKEMNAIGFTIRQHISIADSSAAIQTALDDGIEQADVVLITGGLGPTQDDLTMPTLNNYFGGKLILNKEVYAHIEQLITSRGFSMNKNNRNQALVPNNCKVIHNAHGTAPGLWFEKLGKVIVAMPGVPYETKEMLKETVTPWLKKKFELPTIINQMVYTQGLPESMLAEKIENWEAQLPSTIQLAYLPSPGRVKLRMTSKGKDRTKMQAAIATQIKKLKQLIPQYIYAEEEEDLGVLIGKLLKQQNKTLATAESCTGGYLAHLITQVAGSSAYYKGSVVAYANAIKVNELRVKKANIEQHGAVSQQVVEQMAIGVQQKMKTDYALATSGIAGPTGGSAKKPVGTVWIAVATPSAVFSKKYQFGKLRAVTIERAAITALGMLRQSLKENRE